ncbi:hypothetical protein SNEBB_009088 [Seison nebaliae]|nr:hypothetical protein SNEBB_009088 [Seison nebaliae]
MLKRTVSSIFTRTLSNCTNQPLEGNVKETVIQRILEIGCANLRQSGTAPAFRAPFLEWRSILDPNKREYYEKLIKLRCENDSVKISSIYQIFEDIVGMYLKSRSNRLKTSETLEDIFAIKLRQLLQLACQIPNDIDPLVPKDENEIIEYNGPKIREKSSGELPIIDILIRSGMLRLENINKYSTNGSYIMIGELCELKEALIRFVLNRLIEEYSFRLVSVPNLIHSIFVEGCGFVTDIMDPNQNSSIYRLDYLEHGPLCLSGTAEIALAALHSRRLFFNNQLEETSRSSCERETSLPSRVCAISRCYRAETSNRMTKTVPLYRVHEFEKVEMFCVTTHRQSDEELGDIVNIQKKLLSDYLEIPTKLIRMAIDDIGRVASIKYDIEAPIPTINNGMEWGELTSASNCLDYQSRRLHIRETDNFELVQLFNRIFEPGPLTDHMIFNSSTDSINDRKKPALYFRDDVRFAHTINGTGLATTRTILSLLYQQLDWKNRCFRIPAKLKPFLGKEKISFNLNKKLKK